jgi:hypothetical protein
MPVDRLMTKTPENDVEPVIYYPHEKTTDIIEAHLRADKNLSRRRQMRCQSFSASPTTNSVKKARNNEETRRRPQ